MLLAETAAGCLLRVMEAHRLLDVFSVADADPAAWGERERETHVYLQRIAREETFRGGGLLTGF